MIDCGYPSQKVDEVFKTIVDMPPELVDSYYEMVKDNVKLRVSKDQDYQDQKKAGKN